MSLPPLPGMGATTKEENYDKITAWANAVGALALNALPIKGALGTESLDTVTAPGVYFQGSSANATTENGYPVARPGVLMVCPHASGNVLHEYIYEQSGFTLSAKRWKWSGAWQSWRFDAAQRVDETVGRAYYSYDHKNGREQLDEKSDTGWRTITATSDPELYKAFFVAGVSELASVPLRIKRKGYKVSARIGFDKTAPGNLTCVGTLPHGFRIDNSVSTPYYGSNSAADIVRVFPNTTGMIYQRPSTASGCSALVEWYTTDPWPTVAPGAPYGTIPNL